MAPYERNINRDPLNTSPTLLQRLATVLPKAVSFRIYHLSTPPSRTSALYSPLPGTRPDRTYCASHFLAVSIQVASGNAQSDEVLVYAIEILIYSTSHDTTLFVSKADSTGYLHLLNLSKGTPSPLRVISSVFLQHLVEQHRRPGIRSVVSLFGRAQDQYLFPGSVEYRGKHVLDDRGLIKWWCRVLNPLITESSSLEHGGSTGQSKNGYLVVPGLDSHETLSYIPRATQTLWEIGHPLQKISHYSSNAPPRCLIPHFPDDPKARFLDELDDEIAKGRNAGNGQWKSVKTIAQFWDMMAFRQECSAGRLVGFIWVVFEPRPSYQLAESIPNDSQGSAMTFECQTWDSEPSLDGPDIPGCSASPATSFYASSQLQPTSSPIKNDNQGRTSTSRGSPHPVEPSPPKKKKKMLTGPIVPRQPRIKTENKNYLLDKPEGTAYYLWLPKGRGQVIISESDYNRLNELLLRLDFANLELATSSSARWINEVRSGAVGEMREAWGQLVTGTMVVEAQRSTASTAGVNTLNVGLVRKRRKDGHEELKANKAKPTIGDSPPRINVLSTRLVRKKAKT